MKLSAVLAIDGVLRRTVTGAPIEEGIKLMNGLKMFYNIVLVADSAEPMKDWLDLECVFGYTQVKYPEECLDLSPRLMRLMQVSQIQQQGYAIRLVVEPDPGVAAHLLVNGYNVLNFLHSTYSLPEWRPDWDGTVRPWEELSAVVARNARLRAEDKRAKEEAA
jgi:hypothetical protein